MWRPTSLCRRPVSLEPCLRPDSPTSIPPASSLIGFADDTLVVSSRKTIPELETTANETLFLVSDEIRNLGLSLAVYKTEAVVFTNKYKFYLTGKPSNRKTR